MNLNITTTSNDVFRHLTCTDEQFKEIVEQSINDEPEHFSFQELLYSIKGKVKFEEKPNHQYLLEPKFLPKYLNTINRAIWEQIWDKKLMVNFGNGDHRYNNSFEFQFMKIV